MMFRQLSLTSHSLQLRELIVLTIGVGTRMLLAFAHAIVPTPLHWRGYGYQDDARGAGRT